MMRIMWIVRRSFLRWGSALPSGLLVWSMVGSAVAQDDCFERLDNGVDFSGWQKSTTNMHGPGDGWTVEDGALVGRQTDGQQGGILMTEASYRDVEVILEVRVDWGCDSGLFLRTTDGNRAYQVTIDHLVDSAVGTIWGEAFPQELREIPYWLTDDGNAAIPAPDRHEEPIFDLSQWSSIWDPTAFNEIRARIENNPPHIQVWIADTKVMDFTDSTVRDYVGESGPLAIQVHSGGRWISDGSVAFRNIRVRDLSATCEVSGSGGSGGDSSVGGQPPNPGGASGIGGTSPGGGGDVASAGAGGSLVPAGGDTGISGQGQQPGGDGGSGTGGPVQPPGGGGSSSESPGGPGVAGQPGGTPSAGQGPVPPGSGEGDGLGGGQPVPSPSGSAGAPLSSSGDDGSGCRTSRSNSGGFTFAFLLLAAAISVSHRRRGSSRTSRARD